MKFSLSTQRMRQLVGWSAIVFLLFVGLMAAILNNHAFDDPFVLSTLRWLGEYELFHLVMHIAIFVLVTLAVGLWSQRNLWLVIAALLGGTLLIEGAQIMTGPFTLNIFVLAAAIYDLAVNSIGALIGWLILGWYSCAFPESV